MSPVRARRLAPAGPIPRGRTGAFERISRIPDHRVVDRVLRSRGCIWLIGILLGGIVAMQVSLLRLNSGISRAVQTQSTLEKQNMALQSSIAELTSGERVTTAAAGGQMIDPPAGQTRYVERAPADRSRPRGAPLHAAERAREGDHGQPRDAARVARAGRLGRRAAGGVARRGDGGDRDLARLRPSPADPGRHRRPPPVTTDPAAAAAASQG